MTFIIRQDGSKKIVKNLGWLLRHWKEVDSFSIDTSRSKYSPSLTAHMNNGDRFVSKWADASVLLDWIKRPVFYGLPVIIDGHECTIQKVKNNPITEDVMYLVQIYLTRAAADLSFGIESDGAGWYEYDYYETKEEARLACKKLIANGMRENDCRIKKSSI